jgi:hypothetical protein
MLCFREHPPTRKQTLKSRSNPTKKRVQIEKMELKSGSDRTASTPPQRTLAAVSGTGMVFPNSLMSKSPPPPPVDSTTIFLLPDPPPPESFLPLAAAAAVNCS